MKDSYGSTALLHGCHEGHIKTLKLVLEHAADINHVDKAGRYPSTAHVTEHALTLSYSCWTTGLK